MLKFTKALFLVLAVAAAVVAVVFIVKLFWQLNALVGMAQANRSATVTAPKLQIWISVSAAALTGLFLGIALALPRRTARSIRNEFTRNRAVDVPARTRTQVTDADTEPGRAYPDARDPETEPRGYTDTRNIETEPTRARTDVRDPGEE